MSLRVASRVPSPAFECLVIAETMFDDVDHADLVSLAKRYGIKRDGVQPYDLKWLSSASWRRTRARPEKRKQKK